MPNFNASADLHVMQMNPIRFGQKLKAGPLYLETLPITECIERVMKKRVPDAHLYSITVPLEAGFGKDVLYYSDIEAISKRPDYPR